MNDDSKIGGRKQFHLSHRDSMSGVDHTGYGGASALAQWLHSGQRRQSGESYFEHVASVAISLIRLFPGAPEYAGDAAWLHGSLRHTQATRESLLYDGSPLEAVQIVIALTRPANAIYLEWMAGLALTNNEWALKVALADIDVNIRDSMGSGDQQLIDSRYGPAWRMITQTINRLSSRDGQSWPTIKAIGRESF